MRFDPAPISLAAARWRPRLHRSTYVVAALIAAALVFASIPGRMDLDPGERGPNFPCACVEHGWPWPFLWRKLDISTFHWYSAGTDGDRLAGLKPTELWAIGRNVRRIDFLTLAENVVAGAGIVMACAVLFEAWRRRRYRLFQFYLIELFALMTAACVLLSWLSVESRERHEEQDALQCMDHVRCEEEAAGPHWLRRLIGPRLFEPFDRVRDLCILNRQDCLGGKLALEIAGCNFKHPEELSHLRHLRGLDCGRESAAMVRFLPRPDRLECLECIASDAGLAEIHRCRNLQVLTLHEPERGELFSANGMAALGALGKLRALGLDDIDVDDAAFAKVEKLPGLEELFFTAFCRCGPSDCHLQRIARLKRLTALSLEGREVTDAGLENLKGLTSLQWLRLRNTRITDAGLEHLKGLCQLEKLDLGETKVTDAGVKDLQKALPKLEIVR